MSPEKPAMGERELREKYGGKLAKAINRAIRAEVRGGNEALDTLTLLAGPALHSGWNEPGGNPTPEAAAYFKHKHQVVDKMEATIRRKWKILEDAVKRQTKPRKRAPKRVKR
jgi:hypothetical protein